MKTANFHRRNLPFETECVKFFAEVVQVFGVPKSIGQIYGLLYASPRPLSFSDIVERLEISKGSASQGLQLLRELGAVNVAEAKRNEASEELKAASDRQEGERPDASRLKLKTGDAMRSVRVVYEPELSLRRLVSGVLQERIAPLTLAGEDRLARLRELAEEGGDGNDFYVDRAKQLNTWRRRLRTVLPMFDLMLGPKSRR